MHDLTVSMAKKKEMGEIKNLQLQRQKQKTLLSTLR